MTPKPISRFAPVGPYWLTTQGRLDGGGHYTIVRLSGSYAYRATDFAFPAALPDWYFDAAQL